jgi:hypothetical protein
VAARRCDEIVFVISAAVGQLHDVIDLAGVIDAVRSSDLTLPAVAVKDSSAQAL